MVSNGSGVEPHPQGAGGGDPSNAGVSLKKAQLAPSQFVGPQSSSEPALGTDELVPPTPPPLPPYATSPAVGQDDSSDSPAFQIPRDIHRHRRGALIMGLAVAALVSLALIAVGARFAQDSGEQAARSAPLTASTAITPAAASATASDPDPRPSNAGENEPSDEQASEESILTGLWVGTAHSRRTGRTYGLVIDVQGGPADLYARVEMTNRESGRIGSWYANLEENRGGWILIPASWIDKPDLTWTMDGFRLAIAGSALEGFFFDTQTEVTTGPVKLRRK